nr:MAG TPA: hypothetical protein [Caudoviricetes sp.]
MYYFICVYHMYKNSRYMEFAYIIVILSIGMFISHHIYKYHYIILFILFFYP